MTDPNDLVTCMGERGLTKRELFAALVMQGICAERDENGCLFERGHDWIAKQSVRCANALIAELNKKENKNEKTP